MARRASFDSAIWTRKIESWLSSDYVVVEEKTVGMRRHQPRMIEISGSSGVGKSGFADATPRFVFCVSPQTLIIFVLLEVVGFVFVKKMSGSGGRKFVFLFI